MKYEIVRAESIDSLEDKVSDYINQGWKPQGSVVVVQNVRLHPYDAPKSTNLAYIQPMILDEYVSKLNVARCPY